jgi:hypothetical protein
MLILILGLNYEKQDQQETVVFNERTSNTGLPARKLAGQQTGTGHGTRAKH